MGGGYAIYYGMHLTTLDIMLTSFSLVIPLWLIDDVNSPHAPIPNMYLVYTVSNSFSMSLKNLQVLLKVLHIIVNSFATHKQ